MPDPTIPPMTVIVASNKPRRCASPGEDTAGEVGFLFIGSRSKDEQRGTNYIGLKAYANLKS
jgi:hypothetical protein